MGWAADMSHCPDCGGRYHNPEDRPACDGCYRTPTWDTSHPPDWRLQRATFELYQFLLDQPNDILLKKFGDSAWFAEQARQTIPMMDRAALKNLLVQPAVWEAIKEAMSL